MQALLAAQPSRRLRVQQALLAGLGAQPLGVDAGAVVLHLDADVVAFLLRRQPYPAHARLALRFAQVGHFHAVVDGVADQVHQRIGQRLDQVAVELGLGADQLQVHFLLEAAGDVAGDLGEAREHLAHRLHAGAHDRRLQAGGGDVQGGDGAVQFLVLQARAQGLEPVAREHQFADQVDDGVQALGVHAHGLFRFDRGLGRGRCRCRRRCGCRGRNARGCGRRGGRQGAGAGRGTAVQLVEQAFEFVFGDQVAAGLGGGRGAGRDGAAAGCGAAMQLVQQAFELVLGDQLVAALGGGRGAGRRRAGAGRGAAVQLVEQVLELVFGDQVAGRRRGGHRDRCRGGRGRIDVEQRDQRRRRVLRIGAGRHRVEHRLQPVQRLLRGVEVVRLQHRLARARHAQGFLGGVAQLNHGVDAEEAGAALERVEAAEHRVELVVVAGRLLQGDQLFAEAIQDFLGLDDEIGGDVVGEGAHGITAPGWRAGRRRRSG